MIPDQGNHRFDLELRRLEKRLEELVVVCRQLQEENRSLRQRQDSLTSERASLLQKNEQVRGRVEAMIGRLKGMEQVLVSGAGTFAHVTIKILEKEYNVACPLEEKTSLLASAELLNAKMREIRDSGKVVGLDRVAVMAALNLANELLKIQGQDEELKNIVGLRIRAMREHLDSALGPAKQLTL